MADTLSLVQSTPQAQVPLLKSHLRHFWPDLRQLLRIPSPPPLNLNTPSFGVPVDGPQKPIIGKNGVWGAGRWTANDGCGIRRPASFNRFPFTLSAPLLVKCRFLGQTNKKLPFILAEGCFRGQTKRKLPFVLAEGRFRGQTNRKLPFVLAEGRFRGQTNKKLPFVLAEGCFRGQTNKKLPFVLAEGRFRGQTNKKPPFVLAEGRFRGQTIEKRPLLNKEKGRRVSAICPQRWRRARQERELRHKSQSQPQPQQQAK